jgi:hypothetical protein
MCRSDPGDAMAIRWIFGGLWGIRRWYGSCDEGPPEVLTMGELIAVLAVLAFAATPVIARMLAGYKVQDEGAIEIQVVDASAPKDVPAAPASAQLTKRAS